MKATAFRCLDDPKGCKHPKAMFADRMDMLAVKHIGRSHNGGIMAKAMQTAFHNKLSTKRG